MSQTVPKISEIYQLIIDQLEAKLSTSIPLLPKSFSRVLAMALAGTFIIGYKFAGWVCLQLFVSSATYGSVTVNGRTFNPLEEWGELIGVGKAKGATRAELEISVDVQQQIGNLEAGSKLIKKDTSVIYSVIATVPLDAATITAQVQAVDDDQGNAGFGDIGNLSPGDELEFSNPLPYVSRVATVTQQLVVAADAEQEGTYRTRVAKRFQKRPQGGARVDYQIWGEEVEGIDLVLPYTGEPSDNSMTLYSRSPDEPDGIPTAPQLDAVKQAVLFDPEGFATRAPPGVLVTSLAIFRTEVEVEIVGLGLTAGASITLDELKAKVEAALDAHLTELEPFILGVTPFPPNDRISDGAIGGILHDITRANSGFFSDYIVRIGGIVTTTKVLGNGELAKLKDPVIYS
jgi:hypothetical protein